MTVNELDANGYVSLHGFSLTGRQLEESLPNCFPQEDNSAPTTLIAAGRWHMETGMVSEFEGAQSSIQDHDSTSPIAVMVVWNVILFLLLAACTTSVHARGSFAQISVGAFHACGLTIAGSVKCWGANSDGQLGDGTRMDKSTPVDVIGLTGGVKAVSAGGRSSCALMVEGNVKCWGNNYWGQLGDGTRADSALLRDVRAPLNVVSIDVGGAHACALKGDAHVYCWGYLYSNHQCHRSLWETVCSPYVDYVRVDPTEIPEMRGARQVRASPSTGFYTPQFRAAVCAVDLNGAVRCAQRFDQGTQVVPGLERDMVSVSVGLYRTCGITSGDAVKCTVWSGWGLDDMPAVPVAGFEKGVVSFAPGWDSTCAVNADRHAMCWGLGGLLGDGTWMNRQAPVTLPTLRGVASLSVGMTGACALLDDGQAYCWGTVKSGWNGSNYSLQADLTPIGVAGFSEGVIAASPGPLTGLWWNAAESGWGMQIVDRRETSVATLYMYDAKGQPKWYIAANCAFGKRVFETAAQCSSTLYETQGPLFPAAPFDARSVRTREAGQLKLEFAGRDAATATITVDGVARSVKIERASFRNGANPLNANYSDLWWNLSESGWGLAVTHQANVMFLAWYVYDSTGKPMWYVASNCNASASGCTGMLYQTTGPPSGPTFNPAMVQVITAGTVSLAFTDANNGSLTYTVNGVRGRKAITRQLF